MTSRTPAPGHPARPWSSSDFSSSDLRAAARSIAATGARIYDHGWSPATSSNYSMRLNERFCAVTVSGRDKGLLTEADVMVVDMAGNPASDGKPSAETGLHTQLYRRLPEAAAVLHTHSPASTVLTMHSPQENTLVLEGYELLKAFTGISTHDSRLEIPVFDNTQDIDALAADVDRAMDAGRITHAYLIRGHGVYTWAESMAACYRQLEALEFLFSVTVQRRMLSPSL